MKSFNLFPFHAAKTNQFESIRICKFFLNIHVILASKSILNLSENEFLLFWADRKIVFINLIKNTFLPPLFEPGSLVLDHNKKSQLLALSWPNCNGLMCFFHFRYFISKGAVVDQRGGTLNGTPLHWAVRWVIHFWIWHWKLNLCISLHEWPKFMILKLFYISGFV